MTTEQYLLVMLLGSTALVLLVVLFGYIKGRYFGGYEG